MLWMAPESVSASFAAGLAGEVLIALRSANAEARRLAEGGLLAIMLQRGIMAGLEEVREAANANDKLTTKMFMSDMI